MKKWPELRTELSKQFGLSISQLTREFNRLRREGKLENVKRDSGQSNALMLDEAGEAFMRSAADELKKNPRQIPPQLLRGTAGGNGEKKTPADNGEDKDRGEDSELSARQLAEKKGPANTRKSALDANPEADDDESEGDDEPKSKKPWIKWGLIIGGAALAGLAFWVWMKKKNAAAGGGGYVEQAAPAQPIAPQPMDDGPRQLLTPEEIAAMRGM